MYIPVITLSEYSAETLSLFSSPPVMSAPLYFAFSFLIFDIPTLYVLHALGEI